MSRVRGIDLPGVESRILDNPGPAAAATWHVAYSGGLDSSVLLHLLAGICRRRGTRLVALHADHRLHDASGDWRRHCERQCREWGVECRTAELVLDSGSREGPEARARDARYRWLARAAGRDAWLFTAHHLDDQAETLIERLTRGSGPRGLRGMRPVSRLHGLNVVRPLLDVPRSSLLAYAQEHGLKWVDDHSNRDPRFTRSYLRYRVLPVLRERWPRIDAALARTAAAMADAQAVLDEVAAADLAGLSPRAVRGDVSVDVAALRALSPARQRNVLRLWVHRESGAVLGVRRLTRVTEVLAGGTEPGGGLQWPPVDLRPYRGRLYLVSPGGFIGGEYVWDLSQELRIAGRVILRAARGRGRGLEEEALRGGATVRFRRAGDSCRLAGRTHRRPLKKIFQDAGVPPWQRSRVPLIVVGGEIAAIAGLACCEPFVARNGEAGVEIDVAYTRPAPAVADS